MNSIIRALIRLAALLSFRQGAMKPKHIWREMRDGLGIERTERG